MDALLDEINKDCCKYGVKRYGEHVKYTSIPWTKEHILACRPYCYRIHGPDEEEKLCSRCEKKIHYIGTQYRHEEMLKALSIIAVKQEKQLEQISKLASFMEQLVVHIKSLDKPTST